jgi:hypothetical protein
MSKKWEFVNAFNYAGENYITWIRPSYMREDGKWHFNAQVVNATEEEIKEAQGSTKFYTKL